MLGVLVVVVVVVMAVPLVPLDVARGIMVMLMRDSRILAEHQ